MDTPDFSLILCTLNRTAEPALFLKSLDAQTTPYRIQLIVVDQNPNNRLDAVLAPYREKIDILHLHAKPGLSKARNIGLTHAKGFITAFPDDDCTYPPDLLDKIYRHFRENPQCSGISTLVTDENGNFSAGGRMYRHNCTINRKNVWWCAVSPSIFIRTSDLGDVHFDEMLGVGSGTVFGSGEETDFLLNLLRHRKKLDYIASMVIYHPCFRGPWKMKRGYLYGCGMGYVLRKQGWNFLSLLFYAALQGIRALQSLCTLKFSKMMFHAAMSIGRIRGYFSAKKIK